jgi:chromosome segregation ATPase
MTAPTQSTAPATGETNLDVTAQRLEEIRATLAQVTDQADALAAQKTQLEAQIRAASDHATSTGGTAATQQALDAAQAVVDQLGQHVGNVSQSAVEAGDTTAAAHAGLAPARDAQDMLHAAGATGEHVSAASGATS